MCASEIQQSTDLVAENQRLRERLNKLLLKKPTGPRAQVVTLADCVETNEGYRYGLLLQQTEERELDLLAKLGRLQKAWNRYEADCRPETRNEFLAVAKAELIDGSVSD